MTNIPATEWTRIMLDPKRYGFELCLHCSGYGSSLHESCQRCSKCAGLGLVQTGQDNRHPLEGAKDGNR